MNTVNVPSRRGTMGDDEWAARVDCAALYRLAHHFGWSDLIFTHISLRVPKSEHFLINPFGVLFEEMTASLLVKVDCEGNVVDEVPRPIIPAAFTIHSALHAERKDAVAIMHIHDEAGVAVAAQKRGLLPISQSALGILRDIAYHDYEGIALELDERTRLIRDIGKKNLLILRNHGLLTIGDSPAASFLRLYMLQQSCRIQLRAQAGGTPLIECNDAVVDKVTEQTQWLAGAGPMVWGTLRRLVDRHLPGYDT